MKSRWSDREAASFVDRYAKTWGEDLALRTYTARLLGVEKSLVLHGGGNTSVKGVRPDLLGRAEAVLFVKGSGLDLATLEPEGHPAVRLEPLRELRALSELDDRSMVRALRMNLLDPDGPTPSIEALVHAFLPAKFIDHTHADAVLALTNQVHGEERVREALGDGVIVVDYVTPGFELAKAAAAAYEAAPAAKGMVWMRHGIVTWGDTAREAYEAMTDLVSRAEAYGAKHAPPRLTVKAPTPPEQARERWTAAAPLLRGLLARPTGVQDSPFERVILRPLITEEALRLLDAREGKAIACTSAVTADHIIRTRPYPLWIDHPPFGDPEGLRRCFQEAVERYAREYRAYVERYAAGMEPGLRPFHPAPRVVLVPGLGAACAGETVERAEIARDITEQSLRVKTAAAAMGAYEGLPEEALFHMEYRGLQHAKLATRPAPLQGRTALVTGAAGAIGAGICKGLLDAGAHVAVTDLPGERLESLAQELEGAHGRRVLAVPLDVTDPASVSAAFGEIILAFGGVDLLVVNAGVAHVSTLEAMDLEAFRRLERVNVEGTLNLLREGARHFRLQGTGGDVVLISTKNVFAPGAGFGAYSATKAASHQLARIASLELAPLDVRVNMVAPDAVFSEGARRSGLWAEVGPDRMRARGLDEKGLEEYYRNRNLLKARITARHVAEAVRFFAERRTPTTGATLPVDGGLPDATPR